MKNGKDELHRCYLGREMDVLWHSQPALTNPS